MMAAATDLTAAQKRRLAADPEFQRLLAEDEELTTLEGMRINKAEELYLLMEFLRAPIRVAGLTVQPLTPAVWALLWTIGNGFTIDATLATEADADVFLFLLRRGVRRLNLEIAEIPVAAAGFCRNAGIDYDYVKAEIRELIRLTFRPLALLPLTGASGEETCFGADWLARLCSIVARECNEQARDVMFRTPLSACCAYYVQARRREGAHVFSTRADEEIDMMILRRTRQLAADYCAKKGVK